MLTAPKPVARRASAPSHARTGALRSSDREVAAGRRSGGWVLLVVIVIVLNLVGLVMVLSSSSIESLREFGTPWHYFEREVVWVGIGLGMFAIASKVDPERLRPFARLAMVATVGALCAVLVPGVGRNVAGASRWIGSSSLQLQPSELAKVTFVLFAADVLDRRGEERNWRYSMAPVMCGCLILIVLIMKQPDMGTSLVLGCMAVSMLLVGGLPARPLLCVFGVVAAGLFALAKAAPYRWRRIISFLNPLADRANSGYQEVQGLAGLSHGAVFGTGIGASIATWGYLPNAQTDFIFAVIGEETGLVGAVAVTALFAGLAFLGVRIACRARTRFEALLVAGITTWIVGQAVINIGAVIGLLPVTGVPLPFVSYGGSALVLAMFGIGMVANIARRS